MDRSGCGVLGGCWRCGWFFYAVPVETFTFLFTDVEGSTALLHRTGDGVYAEVLAAHHGLIRSGLAARGGREVDTAGDGFFAVFSSPRGCVAAVLEIQQALAAYAWPGGEPVRVRMGVHCGEAEQTGTGLVGLDVHRRPGSRRLRTAARCWYPRPLLPWSAMRCLRAQHCGIWDHTG